MATHDVPTVTTREALERLIDASERLCNDAETSGARWGSYYETRALIYGIRTNILKNQPAND